MDDLDDDDLLAALAAVDGESEGEEEVRASGEGESGSAAVASQPTSTPAPAPAPPPPPRLASTAPVPLSPEQVAMLTAGAGASTAFRDRATAPPPQAQAAARLPAPPSPQARSSETQPHGPAWLSGSSRATPGQQFSAVSTPAATAQAQPAAKAAAAAALQPVPPSLAAALAPALGGGRTSPASGDEDVEEYSGLYITKRTVPSSELRASLAAQKVIPLLKLTSAPSYKEFDDGLRSGKSSSSDGGKSPPVSWVTIGLVGDVSAPRMSKGGGGRGREDEDGGGGGGALGGSSFRDSTGGNEFVTLRLSNFTSTLSVFAFGAARATVQSEGIIPGSIVLVAHPCILPARDGRAFSLSTSKPGQLIKLGTFPYFGTCAASRKSDGGRCTGIVNTRVSKLCTFHMQADYQRELAATQARRADITGLERRLVPTLDGRQAALSSQVGVKHASAGVYAPHTAGIGVNSNTNTANNAAGGGPKGPVIAGTRLQAERLAPSELAPPIGATARGGPGVHIDAQGIATVRGVSSSTGLSHKEREAKAVAAAFGPTGYIGPLTAASAKAAAGRAASRGQAAVLAGRIAASTPAAAVSAAGGAIPAHLAASVAAGLAAAGLQPRDAPVTPAPPVRPPAPAAGTGAGGIAVGLRLGAPPGLAARGGAAAVASALAASRAAGGGAGASGPARGALGAALPRPAFAPSAFTGNGGGRIPLPSGLAHPLPSPASAGPANAKGGVVSTRESEGMLGGVCSGGQRVDDPFAALLGDDAAVGGESAPPPAKRPRLEEARSGSTSPQLPAALAFAAAEGYGPAPPRQTTSPFSSSSSAAPSFQVHARATAASAPASGGVPLPPGERLTYAEKEAERRMASTEALRALVRASGKVGTLFAEAPEEEKRKAAVAGMVVARPGTPGASQASTSPVTTNTAKTTTTGGVLRTGPTTTSPSSSSTKPAGPAQTVALSQSDMAALLDAKSAHVDDVAADSLQTALGNLARGERLEAMEATLAAVTHREAVKFHCEDCDGTFGRRPAQCYEAGHTVRQVKVREWAFKCSGCGHRLFHPSSRCVRTCPRCEGRVWAATSIHKLREGSDTLHDEPTLLPTGGPEIMSLRYK